MKNYFQILCNKLVWKLGNIDIAMSNKLALENFHQIFNLKLIKRM